MNITEITYGEPGLRFLACWAWLHSYEGCTAFEGLKWKLKCGGWDNPKPRMRIYEEVKNESY